MRPACRARERVEQRLRDEALGHEIGADAAPRERARGAGADRGDAHGAERAGVETGRREPAVEERVDAVRRREHDPRVARRGPGSSKSIGSSAIAGSSITSAPSSSSRARSSLACSRARVTTTRRPNSGRCSNHAKSSAATSPTTIALGASTPASAIVASVRARPCAARDACPTAPPRPACSAVAAARDQRLRDLGDAARAHEDRRACRRRARARPSRCRWCPWPGPRDRSRS